MKKQVYVLLLGTLVITSCGDKATTEAAGAISGTAAIGAPMSDAKVTIHGKGLATACSAVTKADAMGRYSVALNGCSGPFILEAESSAGKVYSIATNEDVGGVVNVTPLTQIIATRVLGSKDLDQKVKDIATSMTLVDKSALDSEVTKLTTALSGLATALGDGMVDIRKGIFTADGSGLDKLLDTINVKPDSSDPTNMVIQIKGTNAQIDVPVSSSTPIDASTVTGADLSAAVTSNNEFVKIKSLYSNPLGDINDCFDDMEYTSCFSGYLHTSFLQDGMAKNDFWYELVDSDESVYIRVGNPVLIEMNTAQNEAWVASDYFEKQTDGSYKKAWLDIVKFKKVGADWKVFGNQNPHPFVVQASAMKAGTTVQRGYNVRIFNTGTFPSGVTTLSITSPDLGISTAMTMNKVSTDYLHFVAPTSHKALCADDTILCDTFFEQKNETPPMFVKISINDGTTTTEQYVTAAPSKNSEFPEFKPMGDLCKTHTPASSFPLVNVEWTLPEGYLTEALDAHSPGSLYYYDWNVWNSDIEYTTTSIPLKSTIVASGGASDLSSAFDIDHLSFSLRAVDENGSNYYQIFSCNQ